MSRSVDSTLNKGYLPPPGVKQVLVARNSCFRSRTKSAKMRDPSRGRGSHALYQGPTLVGPQRAEKELGFTGCGKTLVFSESRCLESDFLNYFVRIHVSVLVFLCSTGPFRPCKDTSAQRA
jgi:hypothetical protein